MSLEFWDQQPSLFALADTDIFLAIDDTDNTSKQFTALVLKTFAQTPYVANIAAAGFRVDGLGGISFDDVNTGITQSLTDLLYDVADTGAHVLRIDNIPEYSFNAGQADFMNNDAVNVRFLRAVTAVLQDAVIFSDGSTQKQGAIGASLSPQISTSLFKQSFDVSTQDNDVFGIFFKPDGLVMFVLGDSNDAVFEYNLTNPWDISTASFSGNSFSVSTQAANPSGLFFRQDGLKFYTTDELTATIFEYNLTTAWDITTASFSGNSFGVGSQNANSRGIQFKADGTKMYFVGGSPPDSVFAYDLSTPWDVSTAVFNSEQFDVSSQTTAPNSLLIRSDGKKLYIISNSSPDSIHEYDIAISWDISTSSFVTSFDLGTNFAPEDMFLREDSEKFYLAQPDGDVIMEFDLGIVVQGNFGIGIVAPVEPLDVVGDMRLTNFRTRTMTRSIPNTIDDAVDIGTFTFTQGAGSLIITITVITPTFSVAKEYLVPVQFDQTANVFQTVLPISSTGLFGLNDFDLEINVDDFDTTLRIRNSLGPVTGTAQIVIKQEGLNTDTFTPSTAVNSVTPPTDIFGSTALTQVNGNVGIGTVSPTEKFHQLGGNQLLEPTNPILAGSLVDAVDLDNPFNVYIVGNYAYVTAADSDTVTIIDITVPSAPTKIGTVTDAVVLNAPRGIFVVGNHAYVSCQNSDNLVIIDVSDPSTPVIVGNLVDSSVMNQALNLYVAGNYAYVTGSITHSLAVIDIRDPTNPVLVGSLIDAVNMNRANSVYVVGNYAYVIGEVSDSLAIVDISNPTNPTLTGSLLDSVNMNGPRGVYVTGKYAYVAGFASNSLAIIDVSDPSIPTLASSLIDSSNLGAATGIQVSGKYAYVGASNSLTILDVSNPITAPVFVGKLQDTSATLAATGVYVAGKFAYVAARNSDSLAVVDISGINAPSASIGNIQTGYLSVTNNAVINNDLYANSLNAGIGGIAWNGTPVSRVGLTIFEIFDAADFPAPVAGVITLPSGKYIIKNTITLSDRIELATDAKVTLTSEDPINTTLIYTGSSNTFITANSSAAQLSFQEILISLTGTNVEFVDFTGQDLVFLLCTVLFNEIVSAGTQKLGTVSTSRGFILDSPAFFSANEGFTITSSLITNIFGTTVIQTNSLTAGTDTMFDFVAIDAFGSAIFDNLTAILNANESLFGFADTITNPITLQGNVLTGSSSFYESGAFLDQTDVNVNAINNTGSPDSMTTGEFDFLNITTPQLVIITAVDTAVAIAGGAWSATKLERVTADVGNNGIATITAVETNEYTINFSALMEKLLGGATNIVLTVLVNGVDTTTNPPRSVNAGIIQISGSRIFTLSTGDTLQLAVFNTGNTDNIEISQATMSIIRGG